MRQVLDMVSVTGQTDASGLLTVSLKCPGTFTDVNPSAGDGRFLLFGEGYFYNPTKGDRITGLSIVDTLHKLQSGPTLQPGQIAPPPITSVYPNYPTVEAFILDEVPTSNRGFYFAKDGSLMIKAISEPKFIPSEFDLQISLQKGQSVVDEFFANLYWFKVMP